MKKEEIRQAVVALDRAKLIKIGKTFNKPILEQPELTIYETQQQILNILKRDDYPHLGPILLDLAMKL